MKSEPTVRLIIRDGMTCICSIIHNFLQKICVNLRNLRIHFFFKPESGDCLPQSSQRSLRIPKLLPGQSDEVNLLLFSSVSSVFSVAEKRISGLRGDVTHPLVFRVVSRV